MRSGGKAAAAIQPESSSSSSGGASAAPLIDLSTSPAAREEFPVTSEFLRVEPATS